MGPAGVPPAPIPTLRDYLAMRQAEGSCRRVTDAVESRFELSAYLSELDGGPAVIFDDVRSDGRRYDLPVVGNLFASRARIAGALGVAAAQLPEQLVAALEQPISPVTVGDGPCREVAVDMPDLAARLPVPWFFEAETAPYITAGAVIARDPRGGAANLSIARLKLLGGNRALIGVAPNHHVAMFAREARSRGEPLPIAVCVGVPPAVLVAACLYLGRGDDEMAYAGALLGEGVATLTTPDGLAVPATSEVVLEGHLDPAEQVAEGPVSEFHGMYEDYGTGPVVTVRRLTRRSDAIFQVVEPGYHAEHALLGAVAIEAGLARGLRSRLPVVRAVRITHAGAGRLAAVVALGPHRTGAAQQVAFGIWSAVSLVKQVTVVDDDVDIDEPAAVAHAVATRVRAERDVLVVPGGPGDRAEPLERDGSVARLAIDATRAPTDRDWRVAAPPADVVRRVRERLATVEIGGI